MIDTIMKLQYELRCEPTRIKAEILARTGGDFIEALNGCPGATKGEEILLRKLRHVYEVISDVDRD